eukprot:SAG31_NODE_5126_length_2725_cov_1.748286_3_plen_208_part_00
MLQAARVEGAVDLELLARLDMLRNDSTAGDGRHPRTASDLSGNFDNYPNTDAQYQGGAGWYPNTDTQYSNPSGYHTQHVDSGDGAATSALTTSIGSAPAFHAMGTQVRYQVRTHIVLNLVISVLRSTKFIGRIGQSPEDVDFSKISAPVVLGAGSSYSGTTAAIAAAMAQSSNGKERPRPSATTSTSVSQSGIDLLAAYSDSDDEDD